MRPVQAKTSEGQAPEPAVPRRRLRRTRQRPATHSRQAGAARWPASGRDETAAKPAGSMRVVMSAIRPRRPAAGGHIAAGRGRACGWRVTDPARRALTRLKVSSRGARPSPQAGSPRSAVPPDGGLARLLAARGTGPGGDAASDLLRHCRLRGERDDRAGCLPRRAAGTRARRYSKSRREGGRRMAHAAGPHRPAARSAAACRRPP